MFTDKEIEEFNEQANFRRGDFKVILDTIQQNGYRLKKKMPFQNQKTLLEQYLIGKGGQSHVFLCENIQSGEDFAIKISFSCKEIYQDMIKELKILETIYKHNFIVQVYEHFLLEEQQICIQIVELCQKSLKDEIDEINSKKTNFSYDQIIKIFLFAINSLCEIHSNNIIHFDIKPANILLTKDGEYKLADFGMSEKIGLNESHTSQMKGGTFLYLSPEQLISNETQKGKTDTIKIKFSTDVYSMGVSLLEILGVTIDINCFNLLQNKKFAQISKQVKDEYYVFYSFVQHFMLQEEENNRYFAFRLRFQFIEYFKPKFPFMQEIQRIIKLIQQYEDSSCNQNNKHLAYLYFYLSQTILDISSLNKFQSILKNLNLSEKLDECLFYEHYSQILHLCSKYEEQNKYLIQSYKIKILVLQNNHLEIAQNLILQSRASSSLGNFQQALEQSQEALQILEILFKNNNPDIALALNNVGFIYDQLGDKQKGLDYYLKALEIYQTLFKRNHLDIASSLNNVGSAYESLGDTQKGLEYMLKALLMKQTLFEGNSPSVATSLINVGRAYKSHGDIQKGLQYYLKACLMYKASYFINHPDIAFSFNSISAAYDSLGDPQKALKYGLKFLQMYKKIFQVNHLEIANSLNSIGCAYDSIGNTQKRIQYYLQALIMYKSIYSGDHPDIADSFNNVGFAYYSLATKQIQNGNENAQKGLKYFLKALQIRERYFKKNHIDIASSLNNVGHAYYSLGNVQKGLEYFLKALQMREVLISGNHIQIVESLNLVSCAYSYLGDKQKGSEYKQKAILMNKGLKPENQVNL